jgi:serine/threonine protein kinase
MLRPGDEPVPGYVLELRIGRGKTGEIWRAKSPGGLPTALKFVDLESASAAKIFQSFKRFRSIRNSHLACVTGLWLKDRNGELLDDRAFECDSNATVPVDRTCIPGDESAASAPCQLIIASLLCDSSLLDRLYDCQKEGLVGIPLNELMRYMREAASVIDFLNEPRHDFGTGRCSIRHLNLNPSNLLLRGGVVVISDLGLAFVSSVGATMATATCTATSVEYTSPECIRATPSGKSDQYSLAVVFVHLRTGTLPFGCRDTAKSSRPTCRGNSIYLDYAPAKRLSYNGLWRLIPTNGSNLASNSLAPWNRRRVVRISNNHSHRLGVCPRIKRGRLVIV